MTTEEQAACDRLMETYSKAYDQFHKLVWKACGGNKGQYEEILEALSTIKTAEDGVEQAKAMSPEIASYLDLWQARLKEHQKLPQDGI
jgi:hypothetical protein